MSLESSNAPQAAALTTHRPTVLTIADIPANLLALGAALADEFDLQIATTGALGIALATQAPPDLILLDVMMPEMDGFETCRRLMAEPLLKDVPVVFVTALGEFDSEIKGLTLGAADYITKPINIEIARQRIRNLLERERLRKEVEARRDQLVAEVVQRKQAEQMLRMLSIAVEQSPASVVITDLHARIEYVNPRFTQVTGYSVAEVMGQNPRMLQSNQTPKEVYLNLWQQLANGLPWEGELVNKRKNGEVYWEESQIAPVKDPAGIVTHYVAVKTDISARKQAQEKLRVSDFALKAISQGVCITGPDTRILSVNDAFESISGYCQKELLGQTCHFLQGALTDSGTVDAIRLAVRGCGEFFGEILNYRKDGQAFWNELAISPVRNEQGQLTHFIGITRDITERKQLEEQVRQLAFFDALTQLPNRRLFTERLRQTLAISKRSASYGALMFLDLDRFKPLNDTHGHDVGDLLLVEVARRLKRCVREMDTVARFGGDEFVVMLSDLSSDESAATCQAKVVAEKIRVSLSGPYQLIIGHEGMADITVEHRCTASIGVVMFNRGQSSLEDILKWADTAMYLAKEEGRDLVRLYAPTAERTGLEPKLAESRC